MFGTGLLSLSKMIPLYGARKRLWWVECWVVVPPFVFFVIGKWWWLFHKMQRREHSSTTWFAFLILEWLNDCEQCYPPKWGMKEDSTVSSKQKDSWSFHSCLWWEVLLPLMFYSDFKVNRWLRVSTALTASVQVLGRKKSRFRFSVTEGALVSYEDKVPVSSIPYTLQSSYWHKEDPRGYGSGIGKRLPSALDSIPNASVTLSFASLH